MGRRQQSEEKLKLGKLKAEICACRRRARWPEVACWERRALPFRPQFSSPCAELIHRPGQKQLCASLADALVGAERDALAHGQKSNFRSANDKVWVGQFSLSERMQSGSKPGDTRVSSRARENTSGVDRDGL
jgi:hypothetical protein